MSMWQAHQAMGKGQLICYWKHNSECRILLWSLLTGTAHGKDISWHPAFPSSFWSMHCCQMCCSRPSRIHWGNKGASAAQNDHNTPWNSAACQPVCCCSDRGAFSQGMSAGQMTFGSCKVTQSKAQQELLEPTITAGIPWLHARQLCGFC